MSLIYEIYCIRISILFFQDCNIKGTYHNLTRGSNLLIHVCMSLVDGNKIDNRKECSCDFVFRDYFTFFLRP